jgi:hypothetical protein
LNKVRDTTEIKYRSLIAAPLNKVTKRKKKEKKTTTIGLVMSREARTDIQYEYNNDTYR